MGAIFQRDKKFSAKKRIAGFGYAIRGVFHAVKTQHNLWIQLFIGSVTIALAYFLSVSVAEWLLIIFAIGLVLMAEIFNSAIELLVDMVSPEYNSQAGKVKDIAAGAVLVSAITAAIIGLIIFIPRLNNFI